MKTETANPEASSLVNDAISRANEILNLLEDASDWRSGEEISKLFNISRAAISKHINSLREEGHLIESATKKGYRLIIKNDPIKSEELLCALKTKVLGRSEIIILDRVDSTNQEAKRRAMVEAPTGTLVFAETQEKGRGTKNRQWFSAPRSLQFSLILRPENDNSEALIQKLSLTCLARCLKEISGLVVTVKAPNDVLIGGKKVVGVLLESGYRGKDLEWLILGIGVNLNAAHTDFPPELQEICSSLFITDGQTYNRTKTLAHICRELEKDFLAQKIL